jgi:hypothetical protein
MSAEDGIAEADLDGLLEHIDVEVLRTDHQIDYQIDRVAVRVSLIESGEESLRLPP